MFSSISSALKKSSSRYVFGTNDLLITMGSYLMESLIELDMKFDDICSHLSIFWFGMEFNSPEERVELDKAFILIREEHASDDSNIWVL